MEWLVISELPAGSARRRPGRPATAKDIQNHSADRVWSKVRLTPVQQRPQTLREVALKPVTVPDGLQSARNCSNNPERAFLKLGWRKVRGGHASVLTFRGAVPGLHPTASIAPIIKFLRVAHVAVVER